VWKRAVGQGKWFPKFDRVDSKTLSVTFRQAYLFDERFTAPPHCLEFLIANSQHLVHRSALDINLRESDISGLTLRRGCNFLIETVFLERRSRHRFRLPAETEYLFLQTASRCLAIRSTLREGFVLPLSK
jgi:hypothetical protein